MRTNKKGFSVVAVVALSAILIFVFSLIVSKFLESRINANINDFTIDMKLNYPKKDYSRPPIDEVVVEDIDIVEEKVKEVKEAPTPTVSSPEPTKPARYRYERDIYIYSHSDVLYDGGSLELKWGYEARLDFYSDKVYVCITAYDNETNVIDAKEKEDTSCYNGLVQGNISHKLTELSLNQKDTTIQLPANLSELFDEKPRYYVVDIHMVDTRDPEGLTSWEGMVGVAETGFIHNGEY